MVISRLLLLESFSSSSSHSNASRNGGGGVVVSQSAFSAAALSMRGSGSVGSRSMYLKSQEIPCVFNKPECAEECQTHGVRNVINLQSTLKATRARIDRSFSQGTSQVYVMNCRTTTVLCFFLVSIDASLHGDSRSLTNAFLFRFESFSFRHFVSTTAKNLKIFPNK